MSIKGGLAALTWLYVGLAGVLGSLARFGMSAAFIKFPVHFLPWGTLLCNWVGCFLLGGLAYSSRLSRRPRLRTAITTGMIGAFTTFSTLSWELFALLRDGLWAAAILYALASLWGGLWLVRLGRNLEFGRAKRGSAE
ncbi:MULTISPECIES: fluoride efflux transporter CrcB [unclassified Paenibacillus]|uniref:fluoride efflux transporter CrcB n=1 Tax=unclassified Paenibacillus TaxID=185978 RepID=UPI00215A5BDD|nr:fluoride efflux transporter CrcB [Paenibacillus sp. tmac-D7]